MCIASVSDDRTRLCRASCAAHHCVDARPALGRRAELRPLGRVHRRIPFWGEIRPVAAGTSAGLWGRPCARCPGPGRRVGGDFVTVERFPLLVLVVLSAVLMVVDARFEVLQPLRSQLGLIVEPTYRVARLPMTLWEEATQQIASRSELVAENEKLKAEAETIAAEGWKWISVAVDFPYGHTQGLRQIEGKPVDLSPEEQATIDALNAEQAKLEVDYRDADELPDEVDQRLGEIESALAAFEDRPMLYEPAEIARAGVFISIDADGALLIERGYVRAEDETPAEPEAEIVDPETGEVIQRSEPEVSRMGAVITLGGQAVETEEEDEADEGAEEEAGQQGLSHHFCPSILSSGMMRPITA